jgi:hypothetical protein
MLADTLEDDEDIGFDESYLPSIRLAPAEGEGGN